MATKENIEKWLKKSQESNGSIIILDTKFNEKATELEKKRREFNDKIKEISKLEILLKDEQYRLLVSIREDLEAKGDKDVWTKDIGFVTEALEEDVFAVHLVKPQQR